MPSLVDNMTVHESPVAACPERLYILPTSLLDTRSDIVQEFTSLSRRLRVPLGWHYLLDLSWAAGELTDLINPNTLILDAGAGTGLMQWWLAHRGVGVISVDREDRNFSRRLHAWCHIVDFSSEQSITVRRAAAKRLRALIERRRFHSRTVAAVLRDLCLGQPKLSECGIVRALKSDLLDLKEIPDGSVDAVVSISSLEHNHPTQLPRIVLELMRIIRPGGKLIATLGASAGADWFHEPSVGWCYSESTLRAAFQLSASCPSNYVDFDVLFESLKNCSYLKDNLSSFYFRSGNNGMPWGRWDPKYQSVGVVKVKPE